MGSQNRVALVTGAGTGIGKATALAFLKDGYRVVLAGRREALLYRTASDAGATAGRALVVPTDVGRPEAVRALFAATRTAFGRLDVLFNNAGVGAPAVPLEDLTYEQWMAVVNVNLTGIFLCTQEAIRIMKEQDPRGGRIINNGSLSAHVPRPFSAPYTTTKHAVTGLTKCTALDGRAHNICCGQIDIGNAATDLTERMASGVLQPNGTLLAEARMDVAHAADAVLHMANLPLESNVLFMTVMASTMPFVGRG